MRGLKIELLPEILRPNCLFFAENPNFLFAKAGKVFGQLHNWDFDLGGGFDL